MVLRPIDRTDRALGRLNAALGIYRETILPEAQNPERQILYWIDHSKDNLTDEFRCFAIQNASKVIGFLQYSYFREEHIFFFEYLCIKDQRRGGLLPSDALRSIEDFLAQNYAPDFTIVFEVAHQRGEGGLWIQDKKLTTYFRRLGFRKIDFEYRYPVLQSYNGEISYPADLMIRLPQNRTTITASELRTVLRSIYFKHYLRWDRPFLAQDQFSERERLINQLYSTEIAAVSNSDDFDTDGDDKRAQLQRFVNRQPRLGIMLERIFRPKLLRLIVLAMVLLATEQILGSVLLLTPFVLALAALYCLAEDTAASRKLFVQIISRMRLVRPRSSLDLPKS
jgi:hypothetical protein